MIDTQSAEYKADLLRSYAKGYAANLRRVNKLQERLSKLTELRAEFASSDHNGCVEYLVSTAEVFLNAAAALIRMRMTDDEVKTALSTEPPAAATPAASGEGK